MAKFRKRALELLGALYDFDSPLRGLDGFSLESPIQPVHDVSREAELGLGGIWVAAAKQQHVGAGALDDQISIDAGSGTSPWTNGFEFDPSEQDAWILGCFGYVSDATDFANARISIAFPTQFIGPYDGTVGSGLRRLYAYGSEVKTDSIRWNPEPTSMPYPLALRGNVGDIILRSDSGGATAFDAVLGVMLWAGPRGVYPPGMF